MRWRIPVSGFRRSIKFIQKLTALSFSLLAQGPWNGFFFFSNLNLELPWNVNWAAVCTQQDIDGDKNDFFFFKEKKNFSEL